MNLKHTLTEKFKQAFSEQLLSKSEFAEKKGISRQAVDNYFKGNVSEQKLVDLLAELGYDVEVSIRLKS